MSISMRAALLAAALFIPIQSALAETLTLDSAVQRAAAEAPSLRANEAAVDAARGSVVQARVRPNPSVTVEAENFIGTGVYGPVDQAEITTSYSQTIERGGKRKARVALAESDVAVARAAGAVARLDLASQVQRAFLDVLLADEAAELADEQLVIAHGLQSEAARRVRSAKDPLFVGTNAEARIAEARIALDQAKRRQSAARAHLASFWGGSGDDLQITGELLTLAREIGTKTALTLADDRLAEAELRRAEQQVDYEQSRARQDYTLSGGARFLRGTNDVAAVASITIPLGRFDRNQGNIARAASERQRQAFAADAARRERERTLATLRREAEAALARAQAIAGEVYPRVTRALAQVQQGYARGGFSFRDMQDAADAIQDARSDYLDALGALRGALADIDRLTGRFDTPNAPEIVQ